MLRIQWTPSPLRYPPCDTTVDGTSVKYLPEAAQRAIPAYAHPDDFQGKRSTQ